MYDLPLPGIRGDSVRTEFKWKDWTFPDLVKALFAWTERNPIEPKSTSEEKSHQEFIRHVKQNRNLCAYCDSKDHTVTTPQARRELLSEKRNCALTALAVVIEHPSVATSYPGSFFGEGKTLVGAGHVT